jgi:aminoglycoside phosphotransferase (APT) family kinase protein
MTELDEREILDRATVAADTRWPGAFITDLAPLHGGVSSITFSARLAGSDGEDRRVVVKVAPPGLPPVRNRDVLRQARVLHALTGVDGVRVPEVLLEDAGSPPFFVMSYVDGDSYEPKKDLSDTPPSPETVDARARAAAQMLARLQLVEPASVGLADEPVLSPAEELDRWAKLFATVPDDLRGEEAELHRRLAESAPEALEPRILHGDYRVGNMQFAGDRLAAIIDWEIWSVGDPRTDLAWLLTWVDPVQVFYEQRDAANDAAGDAMPPVDELLAEYLAIRPGAVPDLDWFQAYSRYKMASTTAVLAKQNRRRPEPAAHMETAAGTLPAMLARAHGILDGVSATRRG